MVIRTFRTSTDSVSCASDRRARRSSSGAFVGGTNLGCVHPQRFPQSLGNRFSQRGLSQFQTAERGRGNADFESQLRLGKAGLDPQIAQVSLVRGGYPHEFGHRDFEGCDHSCKSVHLRGGACPDSHARTAATLTSANLARSPRV